MSWAKLGGWQCQALNDHGTQCRRHATTRTTFSGDPERERHEYGSGELPGWVAVFICDAHGGAKERARAADFLRKGDRVLARLSGREIRS